jgi:hypothetical protein
MSSRFLPIAVAVAVAACADFSLSISTDTGLIGIVVRSPVEPVCRADATCAAPFAAGFSVRQGDRVILAFHSDASGHFEVRLAPGTYVVVPDPDAPVMSPGTQSRQVVVGTAGLTTVRLEFDTGIR